MPEFNPSYLLASDFHEGEEKNLTIRSFEKKDVWQNDGTVRGKWVLYFHETETRLVLNDTNGRAICKLHGTEMNRWLGKKVVLYNNVYQRGIRVRPRVIDGVTTTA